MSKTNLTFVLHPKPLTQQKNPKNQHWPSKARPKLKINWFQIFHSFSFLHHFSLCEFNQRHSPLLISRCYYELDWQPLVQPMINEINHGLIKFSGRSMRYNSRMTNLVVAMRFSCPLLQLKRFLLTACNTHPQINWYFFSKFGFFSFKIVLGLNRCAQRPHLLLFVSRVQDFNPSLSLGLSFDSLSLLCTVTISHSRALSLSRNSPALSPEIHTHARPQSHNHHHHRTSSRSSSLSLVAAGVPNPGSSPASPSHFLAR